MKIAHNHFRGDLERYAIHVKDERIDVTRSLSPGPSAEADARSISPKAAMVARETYDASRAVFADADTQVRVFAFPGGRLICIAYFDEFGPVGLSVHRAARQADGASAPSLMSRPRSSC